MTEKDFQRSVISAAEALGWKVCHHRPGKQGVRWMTATLGSGRGFPDLVIAHPSGALIFAELKAETGKLSEEQEAWARVLGPRWCVWRPSDWLAIEAKLKGAE